MQKNILLSLFVMVFLVFASQVNADESPGAVSENWNFTTVQIGPIAAFQGGGSSYSVIARYLPQYSFGKFSLGADLGLTGFSNSGGADFLVTELGFSCAYALDPKFIFRLLAGDQIWSGGNGSAIFLGSVLQYQLEIPNLSWINGVFLSYSGVFQSNFANQVSAGITLKF